MALYQPTNIYPDLKGGVQNGVILLPYSGTINDVEVSWTVNGNSAMTAYQIDFYQNTAASSLTGSTGKVTLGTPFSAISADGTESRFSVNIAYTLFSATWVGTTGHQGKLKITMWWGSGANDYVEQRSLSVFEMSRAGELSITVNQISAGNYDFSGAYQQPSSVQNYFGTALNWTKWTIYAGSYGDIVQTTGKVWGASSYDWNPTLLLPGNYTVEFEAEQANGAKLTSHEEFTVSDDDFVEFQVAKSVCDRSIDAVKISAPVETWLIPEETDTEYIWTDLSSVLSSLPWTFIWHGHLSENEPLFYVDCKDGTTITAEFNGAPHSFTLNPAGTIQNPNAWDVKAGDEVYICLTLGNFYSNSTSGYQWMIYAKKGATTSQGEGIYEISSFTQSEVNQIRIPKAVSFLGFTLGFGSNVDSLKEAYYDSYKDAVFVGPQINSGGGTAQFTYYGTTDGPFYLYRQDVIEGIAYSKPAKLIGIFDKPLDPSMTQELVDYTAVSGHTYNYFIIPYYVENGNYGLISVQNVTPCFGNWTLIVGRRANKNGDTFYTFERLFRFAWNTQSGSVVNGSTRNIQPTFTPYPAVFRSTQNRRQGTLNGLIGVQTGNNIDLGYPGAYGPTNQTEAALRALSSLPADSLLLLKDQRGNVIKVALAGEISLSVNDKSYAKEITASVPWVEIGDAEDAIFEDMQYFAESDYLTADFNPGSKVFYQTAPISMLRQYLTVTLHHTDGTSETVYAYELSGTLIPGTSEIVVTYLQNVTTFEVTVEYVEIVPFATGSDEQISLMLAAAHAGSLDLQQDAGWAVGDERDVEVAAYVGTVSTQPAHTDQIIITEFGDYNGSGSVLQFDFKWLTERPEQQTDSQYETYDYETGKIRTITIPNLINALPDWLKAALIEFPVLVGTQGGSSTIKTVSGNKLALRAEVELYGNAQYSPEGEGTHVEYYKTASHINKNPVGRTDPPGTTSAQMYFLRSPSKNTSYKCCWAETPTLRSDITAWGHTNAAFFGCL